ncbi:gluconokinase [Neisseria leonii]|uniref:gluconokinase n=1 Tax=Neisseria leonii TaxID=2995413 RepID=UPI00237BE53A|nr:gluconokinase [Neisseria sp. 3986]MDD9326645.1 gluconokinase [Neisseria sp. 3986]
MSETVHIVFMGVSGSGKTTVARILAQHFGCPYAEGDDFHSQANRDKMGAGTPLTDEDRLPWLMRLRDWMSAQQAAGQAYSAVTCSALKKSYRDVLRGAQGQVVFVHLSVPVDVNRQRLEARVGHYMKADMLDSQLAVLEPLTDGEAGITLDGSGTPDEAAAAVSAWLAGLSG